MICLQIAMFAVTSFDVTNRHSALNQHPLLANVAAISLQVGAVMNPCRMCAFVGRTPASLSMSSARPRLESSGQAQRFHHIRSARRFHMSFLCPQQDTVRAKPPWCPAIASTHCDCGSASIIFTASMFGAGTSGGAPASLFASASGFGASGSFFLKH